MTKKKLSKKELFIELAKPDSQTGISDWVDVSEFKGEYAALKLGNGFSWGRKGSALEKQYVIEVERKGQGIIKIRLNGFNEQNGFSQTIRSDIAKEIRERNCVMLGVQGSSVNTQIEVDHKDGRKNDPRVSNPASQEFEDFQPLCKAANDVKRQICKRCKETNKRWSAKNIAGNPYAYYEGDENYDEKIGCVGCYLYDPVEYRKRTIKTLCIEASTRTAEDILSELYGEENKS